MTTTPAPRDPPPPKRREPPRHGAAEPAPPAGGKPAGHTDDEPEERDPGLARERTALSWTRTAISFAALGGVMLKVNVVSGLIILAIAPLIWQLGRISRSGSPDTALPAVGSVRIRLITVSIVAVALLSLVVALLGQSAPGALR